MSQKKYEILETNTILGWGGTTLKQIRALKDFGDATIGRVVKKGDLGGYIESEKKLSQKGNCWIDSLSCAFANARVKKNAWIMNHTEISGDVTIKGEIRLYGPIALNGNIKINGTTNGDLTNTSVMGGHTLTTHLASDYDRGPSVGQKKGGNPYI